MTSVQLGFLTIAIIFCKIEKIKHGDPIDQEKVVAGFQTCEVSQVMSSFTAVFISTISLHAYGLDGCIRPILPILAEFHDRKDAKS